MGCQDGAGTREAGVLGRSLAPRRGNRAERGGIRAAGLGHGEAVPPGEMEPLSCLTPRIHHLPKPLIKSTLEVIKVSPKICSFSKLSLKQNLLSREIQAVEEGGWAGRQGG